MQANEVINIYNILLENNIEIVIDGGWAVDALMYNQTREHNDLDIALKYNDLEKFKIIIRQLGFTKNIIKNDSSEYNFVIGHPRGYEIDVHVYDFDEDNNFVKGIEYPYEALTGIGYINNYKVKCIKLNHLINFHTQYKGDINDYNDVKNLCHKYNLEIPNHFTNFIYGLDNNNLINEAKNKLIRNYDDKNDSAFSYGEVACCLVTDKGNLYYGICIDSSSSMGFCAEHAAISNMLINQENKILKIVAVAKDKNNLYILAPCGRCREFIYQQNPKNLNTDVILSQTKTSKLSELLPYANNWEKV